MTIDIGKLLKQALTRYSALGEQLANDLDRETRERVSRELSRLEPFANLCGEFVAAENAVVESEEIIAETEDNDELKWLKEERDAAKKRLDELSEQTLQKLAGKGEHDERNVILEVRAGTGGEEAALFALDVFRMYARYAELQGWKCEVMQQTSADMGGMKEISANVIGSGAFSHLQFESGVHRVQRVPSTESSGRIHTSAATVAVLPEADQVDIQINDDELRIDVFRASGPGGQSVNTTDSAVRITHLPTGTVVSQQDEKSQHKNKAKALKVLRARLFDLHTRKQQEERASNRRAQVGSGDRSERIRTYNFPQGRVTDHRIGLTLYQLEAILSGDALGNLIEPLQAAAQTQRLALLEEEGDNIARLI